jgi:hypothetical protein
VICTSQLNAIDHGDAGGNCTTILPLGALAATRGACGDAGSAPVDGERAVAARKDETDSCGAIPVYRVDAAYRERAIAAVRQQLAKAGVRPAFLLRLNVR